MKTLVPAVLAAALLWSGCDTLDPSTFEPEVVVSAYLAAGETLPEVRISRTLTLDGIYNADSAAVRDAAVQIELLAVDGSVEASYPYEYVDRSPGIYRFRCDACDSLPPAQPPRVEPLRSYRLTAVVPGFPAPVLSTTTVPDTFAVRTVSRDTVVFQSDHPFTFNLTGPRYPGRQSYFVFNTSAREALAHHLTPFAQSLLKNSDDLTIEDLRERVSPILNEENFERDDDGSLRIQFPWLAIYFYGQNRVVVYALDDNMHDFIRSQSVQQGGSTRPPGEIPNVIDHVEGGRGVFGSYGSASVEFFVNPPP